LIAQKHKISKIKLTVIFLVMISLSATITFFVFDTGNKISSVNQQFINEQIPQLYQIATLRHWFDEQERILYEYYTTQKNGENLPKLKNAMGEISSILDKLSEYFKNSNELKTLQQLNDDIELTSRQFVENIKSDHTDWNQARKSLAKISALGQASQTPLNNLITFINNEIVNSTLTSNKQLQDMSRGVFLFAVFAMILAISVGLFIRKINLQNRENQQLVLFIEKNPKPIAAINWDCNFEFCNQAWAEEFSKTEGKWFVGLIDLHIKNFKTNNKNNEIWYLNEKGKNLEISAHKLSKQQFFMIYVDDITERMASNRKLEFIAYHDLLTGLPNIKKLELDIDKQKNIYANEPFYLLMIGVKQLRQVTSSYGHSVSDKLIEALSLRIKKTFLHLESSFRNINLYRFIGAKFVVLISGSKSEESKDHVLDLLNEEIEKTSLEPLEIMQGSFPIQFQTGCAIYPQQGEEHDVLLKNANVALLEAQNMNSIKVRCYDEQLSQREQNNFELESDLRVLNFEEELFVTYQPKVKLIDGNLIGAEALIRWQHPKLGLISPVQFIPIAEKSGLIFQMGLWIMEKAVQQTKWWHKQGLKNFQIAVNVSPSQLLTPGFCKRILNILDIYHLDPEFLEIEITEEVLARDQLTCIKVLNEIKGNGISIAVDDFGTGYSSLGYLARFPLSKLKIDRSFITDIQNSEINLAIVESIIVLSKSLDIKVIAEGIETPQECDVLKQLVCDQGQGFLFDKPLTTAEFTQKYLPTSTFCLAPKSANHQS